MNTNILVIGCILFGLFIVNIFILVYTIKNKNRGIEKQIINELKIELSKNSSSIADVVSQKISDSNERQLKALMNNKLETVEKLENNTSRMIEAFGSFRDNTSKNINEYNLKLTDSLNNNFNSLNKKIEDNLNKINLRVEERLNEGFERTNKTFGNILERLSKIDEAQKKIDSLSNNILSLQDILTDKKSRGTFGEVQLNHILTSIFGENNSKIFQLQKKLNNGTIVDAVLHLPHPIGMICIDSKFPLENYQKMINRDISEMERKQFERDFKTNVKKHINDIAMKYIIHGQSSEQAIMFLPAEAIFAEINAYHQDLIEYASSQRVWIASPTTIMSVLSTVQIVLRNMEREKYAGIIHDELNKLGKEFKRYKTRWDALARDIKKVSEDVEVINITSNKIEKKFESLSKVEISDEDDENYSIEDRNEKF